MNKFFILSAFLVCLIGCAELLNPPNFEMPEHELKEYSSDFDSSTTLESPAARAVGSSAFFGARWNSKSSEFITVVVSYTYGKHLDPVGIRVLSANYGDRVAEYKAHRLTDFRSSYGGGVASNVFVVPWEDFKAIATDKSVKLRITTSDGYEDIVGLLANGSVNDRRSAGELMSMFYQRVVELKQQ